MMMVNKKFKNGFTLVEILVVIAIISLLMAILIPSLARARLQAKVLVVNAELKQIGLAIGLYTTDNNNKYPPTHQDCMEGEHYNQLPRELTKGKYLPAGPGDT